MLRHGEHPADADTVTVDRFPLPAMLRSALGIFYPARISNDELFANTTAPSVEHDSAATPGRPHTAHADQIEIPSRRAPAELRIWSSPPWARTDRDTAERYHHRPFIIVY
ncbi:hypothetical protein ACOMHN_042318 [Nucella lapillus]